MSHPPNQPMQPWLHELTVIVDGPATVLSRRDGQISGHGAQGFFLDDSRVMSVLEVEVAGRAPDFVGGAARGATAQVLGSLRHLGDRGPDPSVEALRRRHLDGATLVEEIEIRNRATETVHADLTVRVGGDGAELADVKQGIADGTQLVPAEVDGASARWRTARHEVLLELDGITAVHPSADGGLKVVAAIEVPSGGSSTVRLAVGATRTRQSLFDAEAAKDQVTWSAEVSVEAADGRLAPLVHTSVDDLQHLLLNDPVAREDFFVAAGTPWYLTLFGRDSLWAARLALPLGTELAGGTLRALARRQGTDVVPARAEAPGKIPHELRRVPAVEGSHDLRLPPVYYGTVDATALWICTLHEAWRWGLPTAEVIDLLPALRRALTWLTEIAPGPDGLLRYLDETGTGLANQGWKDSGDSMRWRDGRIATGPIALLEAQAYAVEAAYVAADLLAALGTGADRRRVPALRAFATRLAQTVRERFWVTSDAGDYLAMALDGAGHAVTGVGSNMGHALGTRTLTQAEADRVAVVLTGPTLLLGGGIATLATDNGGFNPLGYHTGSVWVHDTAICALGLARQGHADRAVDVVRRLVGSGTAFAGRFPELFADGLLLGGPAPYPASCRPQAWASASSLAILRIVLGLDVDAPARCVTIRPPLPLAFGAMRVAGLRVAGRSVTIEVRDDGVVSCSGLPSGWTVLTGPAA